MTTTFFIPFTVRDLPVEVERWLHANIGPSVIEVDPKTKIKKYAWQSGLVYSGDWKDRYIKVELWNETEALAFKLRWLDEIKRTVTNGNVQSK
jgi:hypothetical protein